MKKTILILLQSLVLAAFAQDWDDALEATTVKVNAAETLRLEVEDLRKAGMRYAFLPPPEGTVWGWMKGIETPVPNNWTYNAKTDCLESRGGKRRNAVIRFPAPRPGKMFLWFRYRDVKRQVNYTGEGALVVRFRQGGKAIGTWKLPRTRSPLCDRMGWRKYGVQDLALGWPVSVWQDAVVVVPQAGEVEAEIAVVDRGNYALNAWVATPDPLYEPRLEDFHPLWLRITSLPGETQPFKPHLYKGVYNHAPTVCSMTNAVPPGGDSGWFYAARFAGRRRTIECTLNGPKNAAKNRFARVELSRTPDVKGVFFREELKGHGNRIAMQLEEAPWTLALDAPYTVRSNVTESEAALRKVRELAAQKGRAPRRFRFELPLALGVESYEPFVNEMNVSLELGCGVQPAFRSLDTSKDPTLDALRKRFLPVVNYRSPMPFSYWENGYDKCICSVRREKIAEWTKKIYAGTSEPGMSGWWDEPTGRPHRDCVIPCTQAYRAFLREMKLMPKDVGAKNWDRVFPVLTATWEEQKRSMDTFAEKFKFAGEKAPTASAGEELSDLGLDEDATAGDYVPAKAPERYYWSQRYHLTKLRRFTGFATAEVEKYNREVLGGACLSPDIVDFYDGIRFGTDWFDFFEHRGFNIATSEDWHNVSGDYSVCGFLTDFLRGCARRQNLPVRLVTVMCNRRTPWEVTAKAFTEIGRGATDIWFYGYGPSYARMDESASDVPGMYAAIKSVTFPVGAVEDVLLDGERSRAPIAQLYSVTGDIRAHADGRPGRVGSDRIWTNMLLTHLGRDVDVINEDGLFDFLKDYRFLWCGEDAVRRACVKPLSDWIAAGGTLFLTEGALATDEFGRPLGFDTTAGSRGKGRVVAATRFGNAYRKGRERSKAVRGMMVYPEAVRTSCAAILDEAGVPMSVRSSVYNVEAHLFRGKESDALVVANWTGEPQDVTLSLKDGSYRRAETFNSALVAGTSRDGIYELEVKGLPAGDCVRLLK